MLAAGARVRSPLRALLAAAALVATLALGLTHTGQAGAVVHTFDDAQAARQFWTKERMRRATPMTPRSVPRSELPDGGEALRELARSAGRKRHPKHRKDHLPRHPRVVSGPVPHPAYPSRPWRATGRLFMRFPSGLYSCSATVVRSKTHSTILTAGHCIYGKKQGFATAIVFVPGYYRGHYPRGVWVGVQGSTTKQWILHRNEKYDYAAVRMAGRRNLGKVNGELGVAIDSGRHHREMTLGYPNNRGRGEVMWACLSKLIGDDPYDHGPGRKNIAIACDMSHGCSGGPWEFHRGHRWYVNSVSSYFYKTKRFDKILFGPYFTKKTRRLIGSVQG